MIFRIFRGNKVVSRARGFTLIEVLLGLSIFSIIAMSLYSVFSAGIMLTQRAHKQDNTSREIFWISKLLRYDLENAVSFVIKSESDDGEEGDEGEGQGFIGMSNNISLYVETGRGITTS